MRVVLTLMAAAGWLIVATECCASDGFPYTARVARDQIEVRCGPGWDYYATAVLKRDATVEVYRQESGGWLAIRPPAGSFSWVAARHLESTQQRDVLRVTTDGVVAWIGSSIAQVSQHKWQVRLKQNELLDALGKQAVAIGAGFAIESYYKIAPPAGEFRWIHAKYAQPPKARDHQVSQPTIELIDAKPVAPTPLAATTAAEQPIWTAATKPAKQLSSTALHDQVEQLNVDLGMLVSHPMEQWMLDDLRERVAELVDAARNTQWADSTRELARRVRDFEDLQRRYRKMLERDFSNVRDEKTGVSAAPRLLDPNDDSVAVPPAANGQVDPVAAFEVYHPNDFDAEGWLVPVHSTKRIAPPFAVLDDEGRVRCYVSPLPGLNLRRYQRMYVGLYGQRRYVKSLQAPHVTAERVVKQKREPRTD